MLLLLHCGSKLGPGRKSQGRLPIPKPCQMEGTLAANLPLHLLEAAPNHATHTATVQGTHRSPQPAGNSAYLTDFQPWSILYFSSSGHRSCLIDSLKNHTHPFPI